MTELVVGLPGSGKLAADLAALLGAEWLPLRVHRFPDGETLVGIDAEVRGRTVVLAGSLDHPDPKTLPLLFAADCARELGAARVGLVAPYLAYMRQDARFHPGDAVTSATYARQLSASLDFLVTVDPHLHRHRTLAEIYSLRACVVHAAPAMAEWIVREVSAPVIVGPDEESAQWAGDVAAHAQAPFFVLRKRRRDDAEVEIEFDVPEAQAGRTPVLVDDIVSTGATLRAAARALVTRGWRRPWCVAVHALLDTAETAALRHGGVERFVSCDCVPHASNQIRMAPALAAALRELLGSSK